MTIGLINFQSTLIAAGFSKSVVVGGPQPDRQGVAVVAGELSRVPAEGFAVSYGQLGGWARISPERRLEMPQLNQESLKDRLHAVTRGLVWLFSDAADAGWKSLAVPVPQTSFFGDLDHGVAIRAVLGAADIFWRIQTDTILNHVIVAVDAAGFSFSL